MIYFCIPALNEERTVGVVLWKLRQVMTEMQRDFQIIVVDDASTGDTAGKVAALAREFPDLRLRYVRLDRNMGGGAARNRGVREATDLAPLPAINETLNVVSIPELSIYSNRDRMGVAEFSGFIYDARTGQIMMPVCETCKLADPDHCWNCWIAWHLNGCYSCPSEPSGAIATLAKK